MSVTRKVFKRGPKTAAGRCNTNAVDDSNGSEKPFQPNPYIFGFRTPPKRSGHPIGFICTDCQATPLILDPLWTKFDALGPDQNFDKALTSPVLLCTIEASAFLSMKMATHGFHTACCCWEACRRHIFFGENSNRWISQAPSYWALLLQVLSIAENGSTGI